MYTTVHILPPDLSWQPDEPALRKMLEHFKPASLNFVAYRRSWRWAKLPPKEAVRRSRLSIEEALAQYRPEKYKWCHLLLNGVEWSLPTSLGMVVPPSISDGYVCWDVQISIGSKPVPDLWQEAVLCETHFDLTISGDGVPSDPARYLDFVRATTELNELRSLLSRIAPGQWDTTISAST